MGAKKKLGGGSKYTKKEVMDLKSVFDSHDADGGGEVAITELMDHMKLSGGLAEQAVNMFRQLDKDGSGSISFEEYLRAYYNSATKKELAQMCEWANPKVERPLTPEKTLSSDQMEEIKNIFMLYDVNGDGVLDRPELVEAMTASGYDEDEIEDLFDEYDDDGTNTVDYEEFCKMLQASYL
mmetsp:Transcript_28240/g.39030  ORF Transcript_28240/g.39030 Transcript_28240/m.39030 type:complete len:181 (+) Transcript_28240:184-726(+)|eukprot:CAMPEP_0196595514 /NCGR_PEP_ID=MMETSP1081-20130531/81331_1 /TAXON_ID=36882 /ORGANISM="Pyramimonas amylifera, Strain CCMP720" /LENGTH=180 /DNA_ID=CAMNT_0041920121 /DNA_START=159 /DNA_END=701 /DNA_ORIENTATION=+